MFSRTILLAVIAAEAFAPSASGQQLAVGLTVRGVAACDAGACLRRLPGRFHAATIVGARPRKHDRRACVEAFDAYLLALARNASPEKRQLYRMWRCRALGLAPIVERVAE